MADREDIAYKSDLEDLVKGPSGAISSHLAVFGSTPGTIVDSDVSLSDIPTLEDLPEAVGDAVASATSEIWNAVKGVEAIQAYGSPEWQYGEPYLAGDLCRYYNETDDEWAGYKCLQGHTSGDSSIPSESPEVWEIVLTSKGYDALAGILSGCSTEGLASLLDLAPAWSSSSSVRYEVGQLAKKDGVLQICTEAGYGVSAIFTSSGATVEASIASRISALNDALRTLITQHTSDSTIHVTASDKVSWNGKQDAIADLSDIRADAAAGAIAAGRDMVVVSNGTVVAEHADGTGTVQMIGMANLPYEVRELLEIDASDSAYDDTAKTYRLFDRTINVIGEGDSITDNTTIKLIEPAAPSGSTPGKKLARDFFVVFLIDTTHNVSVSMPGMSLKDYNEGSVSLVVPSGEHVTYRFTDSDENQTVFLVTLFADPANVKVREIEQALDTILIDGGGGDFTSGVYIEDEHGLFHKLTAVTDPETGEVNIGVDQTGEDR